MENITYRLFKAYNTPDGKPDPEERIIDRQCAIRSQENFIKIAIDTGIVDTSLSRAELEEIVSAILGNTRKLIGIKEDSAD